MLRIVSRSTCLMNCFWRRMSLIAGASLASQHTNYVHRAHQTFPITVHIASLMFRTMSPSSVPIRTNSSLPNPPLQQVAHHGPDSRHSHRSSASLTTDLESAKPLPTPLEPHRHHPLQPGFTNAPPFRDFFRKNWYDIMTQLLCLAASLSIYHLVPPIMPRYFPYYPGIESTPWGLAHSKPIIKEYIETFLSAALSFLVPALVMGAIALWGTRRFEDGNAAVSLTTSSPDSGQNKNNNRSYVC